LNACAALVSARVLLAIGRINGFVEQLCSKDHDRADREILVPEKRADSSASNLFDRSKMVGLRVGSIISVSDPEVADLSIASLAFRFDPAAIE